MSQGMRAIERLHVDRRIVLQRRLPADLSEVLQFRHGLFRHESNLLRHVPRVSAGAAADLSSGAQLQRNSSVQLVFAVPRLQPMRRMQYAGRMPGNADLFDVFGMPVDLLRQCELPVLPVVQRRGRRGGKLQRHADLLDVCGVPVSLLRELDLPVLPGMHRAGRRGGKLHRFAVVRDVRVVSVDLLRQFRLPVLPVLHPRGRRGGEHLHRHDAAVLEPHVARCVFQ